MFASSSCAWARVLIDNEVLRMMYRSACLKYSRIGQLMDCLEGLGDCFGMPFRFILLIDFALCVISNHPFVNKAPNVELFSPEMNSHDV